MKIKEYAMLFCALFLFVFYSSAGQPEYEYTTISAGADLETGRAKYDRFVIEFEKPLPIVGRANELELCNALRDKQGIFYPEVLDSDASGIKKIAFDVKREKATNRLENWLQVIANVLRKTFGLIIKKAAKSAAASRLCPMVITDPWA